MLGSTPVYEIVTGQILLGRQFEFFRLHRDVLLPMLREVGVEPALMVVTEVGSYLKFLDVYRYPSLEEYGRRTDAFLRHPEIESYYRQVGQCINGSIQVELAREFGTAAGGPGPGSSS
jgi:hypothetical protein